MTMCNRINRFLSILLFAVFFAAAAPVTAADTAAQQFYSAEAYCLKFLKNEKEIKYRDNWLECIRKFQAAYQTDPASPLAPASLYMAGKLYHDLYRISFKRSDKEEAVDVLSRVVKRFPKSDYRKRAETLLTNFDARPASDVEPDAESDTPYLKKKKVEKAFDETADGADVKLKKRGVVFKQSKADYHAAVAPAHSPEIEADAAIPERPKYAFEELGVVNGLRVWSNPNYTRIVVDATAETTYNHRLLKQDISNNKPPRLYVDFDKSRLGRDLKTAIPIDDDLLISARAGQCTPDSVRVVVDLKSFKTYKIFSLSNPFRTIIDVWGSDAGVVHARRRQPIQPAPPAPPASQEVSRPMPYEASIGPDIHLSPHDLAKQLALGVRRIVIDPGHGGHDSGAPGYYKGVVEKDIVLDIARRLARKMRRQLGCEVIMTRDSDRFLTLEERTAIANTQNADLFISIHCNAHRKKTAYGIETYFLNLATDDDAILVAARENAASRKNISDLQTILLDLMQNAKINESSRLATHVQNSLYSHMKSKYSNIKNKGVKQAPFYVLLGAQMPSILVETSFISNKVECKRLMSANYQEHLCNAIIQGVTRYIKETSPTAFFGNGAGRKG